MEEVKKKHFFRQWPEISQACDPENIKWKNLGTDFRLFRAAMVWIVALALVLVSLGGIVMLKNITKTYQSDFDLSSICPKKAVSKEKAWFDFQKLPQDRLGLMKCYCEPIFSEMGLDIVDLSFTEFQNKDGNPD